MRTGQGNDEASQGYAGLLWRNVGEGGHVTVALAERGEAVIFEG